MESIPVRLREAPQVRLRAAPNAYVGDAIVEEEATRSASYLALIGDSADSCSSSSSSLSARAAVLTVRVSGARAVGLSTGVSAGVSSGVSSGVPSNALLVVATRQGRGGDSGMFWVVSGLRAGAPRTPPLMGGGGWLGGRGLNKGRWYTGGGGGGNAGGCGNAAPCTGTGICCTTCMLGGYMCVVGGIGTIMWGGACMGYAWYRTCG